jgi:hypothetical protein
MMLEMITRDALKIPMLGAQYWATFPEARAADLARVLRFARDNSRPRAAGLAEDENVIACLAAWETITARP